VKSNARRHQHLGVVICAVALAVGSLGAQPPAAAEHPVFAVLRAEFQKRNPAITRVVLNELHRIDNRYVAIAVGHAPETPRLPGTPPNFEDELHIIALLDRSLSRVERVLDLRPTPEWDEFFFTMKEVTRDGQIVVLGEDSRPGGPLRLVFSEHLGSGFAETVAAAAKVVRLKPGDFRQLPRAVTKRLNVLGCLIPQSPSLTTPHNVISGSFAVRGQIDWAVVCSIDGETAVLVFWGGLAGCGERLGRTFQDTEGLEDFKWNFVIRKISAAQINKRDIVETANHDGIDVGTSTYVPDGPMLYTGNYCDGESWLTGGFP
jgi:hypothetical protein